MHQAVSHFISANRPKAPGRVLDVGGRDVNGTLRSLFLDADQYMSVDLRDGPAVDIVGDITDQFVRKTVRGLFDTVICTEVLEHAENWRDIVKACADALDVGGTLMITCAGPGRAPHSAIDEQPIRPDEYYGNVSADELADAFRSAGISPKECAKVGDDTQGYGVKVANIVFPARATLPVPNPSPFPHAVIDDLWSPDDLDRILEEFPSDDAAWRRYRNQNEDKAEGSDPDLWGPHTRAFLDMLATPLACATWGEMFGIPDLTMRTMGGGYHLIKPGGKLGVHADFNRSTEGLYRRLNLLVYLNHDWSHTDGGRLELWDDERCVEEILPVFNRTVVFATSSTSYHGHPEPLPGPRSRRSIAAYYFSPEPAPDYVEDHSTVWRP